MKKLLGLSLLLASSAFAGTCNVKNYKDAIECITKDSYSRYTEGEIRHSVGVTRLEKGKLAFEKITGKKPTATYVGVVEVHYDEDQLLYYEINRGENVEPVLVVDFNIVDLTYQAPELEELEDKQLEEILTLFIPISGSLSGFHLY